MSAGPSVLINYLLLASIVLVVILAIPIFITKVHPENSGELGFMDTFWLSLMHVLDPGNLGEQDGNLAYRLWMLVITIFGIIVVSTLIGLISNGILDNLNELRKGRSHVTEQDHVLILGWSSKIFTIISELIIANENQNDPKVVILADKDKVEMEDLVRDNIPDSKNTRIICRTGDPIDIYDLEIGNPSESKSIIILDKENENSDSQIIKAILAIVSSPKRRRKEPYHITAEIEHKDNFEVARMVGGDEVELVLSEEFVSKVMVQTSRQPGLSVVYTELMDFGGDEIYFADAPELVGKTFREALFSYEDSAIIGIQLAGSDHVEVNPPMNKLLQQGDRLIGITEDDDTMVISGGFDFKSVNENIVAIGKASSSRRESILIIGWNHRAKTIITELDKYVEPGSSLRIVSKFEVQDVSLKKLTSELDNLTLSFEKMETTDRDVLESLECFSYDYILLLCYQEHYPLQEADAQTLITLLHMRDILERSSKKISLVSEMLDMKNRQLADVTSADDFIVSDKLLSLLMTQVAENKYLMRVFEELLDADGSEIYIKPVTNYVLLDKLNGQPINFYTVLESAARKNEVAIGYRLMSDFKNPKKGYGVVVNPKKSEPINFSEGDMVIVLSEN